MVTEDDAALDTDEPTVFVLYARQWDGSGIKILRVYGDKRMAERDAKMLRTADAGSEIIVSEAEHTGNVY